MMLTRLAVVMAVGVSTGACVSTGGGRAATDGPPLYERMTEDDVSMADATLQYTLEHALSRSTREWSNPGSGHSGSVTPTRTYKASNGLYCRSFVETLTVGRRTERYRDDACRDVDGKWKPVG
jgi:surface antigen